MNWQDVRWMEAGPPDGWRGQGGLPPGYEEWLTSDVGDVYIPPPWHHLISVVRAPAEGRSLRALVLSDHLQSAYTHWTEDGLVLCLEDPGSCPHCVRGSEPSPLGWLLVDMPLQYPRLLELPAGVVRRSCYLGRPDARLRGRAVKATRTRRGKSGPVEITLGPVCKDRALLDGLRSPVDVRPIVTSIYG